MAGALEYHRADGERLALAVVHGWVAKAESGWEYTLQALDRYYERVLSLPAEGRKFPPVDAPLIQLVRQEFPAEVPELVGTYLESARLLGLRTAELHRALAADGKNPEFAPEPFTTYYQRSLYQTMRNTARHSLQQLRDELAHLPEDARPAAQRVVRPATATSLRKRLRSMELFILISKEKLGRMPSFGELENPEYYLAVTNAIEPHTNLVFSIKYQQGDFLRMTPFNPTLGIGKHRQIVEAQSSMEVYGKGSHPYYSAYGVINGWPETKYEIENERFTGKLNDPENPRGIKNILNRGLLCGINTWSRGGGWQGPYITNEFWTDLNTYVVSRWAQNPSRSEEEIFFEFAAAHNMTGMLADQFRQIALLSIEGVRKGQCNSFTINQGWWSRDEFFSASANQPVIDSILKNNLTEKVLSEKAEASAIWRQIEAVSNQMTLADTITQEAIRVSSTYGRIKYELIEQMWILMLEDGRSAAHETLNKQLAAHAIQRYDALWVEWRKLKESSAYCATLYSDMAFRNNRNGSIGELIDNIRKKLR